MKEEKIMKRRIQAFAMAFLMILLTVLTAAADIMPVYAEGGAVLKLHYNSRWRLCAVARMALGGR